MLLFHVSYLDYTFINSKFIFLLCNCMDPIIIYTQEKYSCSQKKIWKSVNHLQTGEQKTKTTSWQIHRQIHRQNKKFYWLLGIVRALRICALLGYYCNLLLRVNGNNCTSSDNSSVPGYLGKLPFWKATASYIVAQRKLLRLSRKKAQYSWLNNHQVLQ